MGDEKSGEVGVTRCGLVKTRCLEVFARCLAGVERWEVVMMGCGQVKRGILGVCKK